MRKQPTLTYIGVFLISALILLFSSAFQASSSQVVTPTNPFSDTLELISIMNRMDATIDKGLWEAVSVYKGSYSIQEVLAEVAKVEKVFGSLEQSTSLSEGRDLEYIAHQDLGGNYQLSLRLLGKRVVDEEYELYLIVKLESTSLQEQTLQDHLTQLQAKLNLLEIKYNFYSCVKGSIDDTLKKVYNYAEKVFFTYDSGEFVDQYQDQESYGVRNEGKRSTNSDALEQHKKCHRNHIGYTLHHHGILDNKSNKSTQIRVNELRGD